MIDVIRQTGMPITPETALSLKQESIPEFVIEAFNECIVENLDASGYSSFKQDDVIERILIDAPHKGHMGLTRNQIFSKGWLDVEPKFRAVGWTVKYSKPAYNDEFTATFVFKAKGSK